MAAGGEFRDMALPHGLNVVKLILWNTGDPTRIMLQAPPTHLQVTAIPITREGKQFLMLQVNFIPIHWNGILINLSSVLIASPIIPINPMSSAITPGHLMQNSICCLTSPYFLKLKPIL